MKRNYPRNRVLFRQLKSFDYEIHLNYSVLIQKRTTLIFNSLSCAVFLRSLTSPTARETMRFIRRMTVMISKARTRIEGIHWRVPRWFFTLFCLLSYPEYHWHQLLQSSWSTSLSPPGESQTASAPSSHLHPLEDKNRNDKNNLPCLHFPMVLFHYLSLWDGRQRKMQWASESKSSRSEIESLLLAQKRLSFQLLKIQKKKLTCPKERRIRTIMNM